MSYVKIALPISNAISYVRGELNAAGGFSALVRIEPIQAFAIGPIGASASDVLGFQVGKRWSQANCDAALVDVIEREMSWTWWAFLQNVWSTKGDLPNDEELGDHIFYAGSYLHVATQPNTIDLRRWRSNAISPLKIMYLSKTSPLALAEPKGDLGEADATALAEGVFAIAVSAYDDESWVVIGLKA